MSSSARASPVEAQPLIAVRDVQAGSRWYAELLGTDSLPDHPHRDVYDRIWRSGRLRLQLHAWDADEHPNLVNADAAPPGHGVMLWFQVKDFDRRFQLLALTRQGRPITPKLAALADENDAEFFADLNIGTRR